MQNLLVYRLYDVCCYYSESEMSRFFEACGSALLQKMKKDTEPTVYVYKYANMLLLSYFLWAHVTTYV